MASTANFPPPSRGGQQSHEPGRAITHQVWYSSFSAKLPLDKGPEEGIYKLFVRRRKLYGETLKIP
ncbi:MAG: hypothetical protein DRO65_03555 [Candidatus Altiarchaeales archaeon]|nr:MAG: hypothetical protein DRO65_03555 [Candidatus Altiarchaeales archaeon]